MDADVRFECCYSFHIPLPDGFAPSFGAIVCVYLFETMMDRSSNN